MGFSKQELLFIRVLTSTCSKVRGLEAKLYVGTHPTCLNRHTFSLNPLASPNHSCGRCYKLQVIPAADKGSECEASKPCATIVAHVKETE